MPKNASLEEARAKRLKFYVTGKPCRHGHLAPRRTLDRGCTACRSRIDRKDYYKHREKRIAKTLRWRAKNPEKWGAWLIANPEKVKRANKKWKSNHRDKINATQRAYRKEHLPQFNAYFRKYYANDPQIRIRTALRARLLQTIKHQRGVKSGRAFELLGCSLEQFKVHLERQFLPRMNWENYGYGDGKWHIDHIRPVSVFDLTDPGQQRACFHFTNLQPLWQADNFRKGDQVERLL
jgi:hypothetical protein